MMKLNYHHESFIYKLNQDLHYSDIYINSKAILNLFILDYNKKGNKYDTIIVLDENKKLFISGKEEYLTIINANPRHYDYFPCKICLLNSKDDKTEPIIFSIYIYNCLLNKINVFLNTNCQKTYFYEYLYYNITQPLKDIEQKIIVNALKYSIKEYDNFSSRNRKRICILNIHYQNIGISEKELINNSIQVNELILEDKKEVVAINDIYSTLIKKPKSNSYFNRYYPHVGDIYDLIKETSINNRKKAIEIMTQKIEEYKKIKFEYDIKDIYYFEDKYHKVNLNFG